MIPLAASAPLIAVNAGGRLDLGRRPGRDLRRRPGGVDDPRAGPSAIAFFRALGRSYGIVGGLALLVALASGARSCSPAIPGTASWSRPRSSPAPCSSRPRPGSAQARAMTRLRRRALEPTGVGCAPGSGASALAAGRCAALIAPADAGAGRCSPRRWPA